MAIHLNDDEEKVNLLAYMAQKLVALVKVCFINFAYIQFISLNVLQKHQIIPNSKKLAFRDILFYLY